MEQMKTESPSRFPMAIGTPFRVLVCSVDKISVAHSAGGAELFELRERPGAGHPLNQINPRPAANLWRHPS